MYVAELFKERFIRRDNHTFKSNGFFCFLERGVGCFDDRLPLRDKSAVRFFVIVVEWRSRIVNIFVAVMTACPFCFTADFPKRAFAKFFYSNDLITYNIFLLKIKFIAYTGGVVGFGYIHISLRYNAMLLYPVRPCRELILSINIPPVSFLEYEKTEPF